MSVDIQPPREIHKETKGDDETPVATHTSRDKDCYITVKSAQRPRHKWWSSNGTTAPTDLPPKDNGSGCFKYGDSGH